MNTRPLRTWVALGCAVLLVFAVGLWWALRVPGGTTVSALFDKAIGLYAGSEVRILGVDAGTITAVVPEGASVRVRMRVDEGIEVPANAGAVVVAPSLVSDRYVQLTPAYTGGPELKSGTLIPRARTATPAELDDLYSSLNTLSTALGPNGANKNGAVSGSLDTLAANLKGNGRNVNQTISALTSLSSTLNNSKGDFFATVGNLRDFTTTLADSDAQVNALFGNLATVSTQLGDDTAQINGALSSLGDALGQVRDFVGQNKSALESNVDKLTGITKVLADRRAELAETLDEAPTGANNLVNSYDAASGTIAVRADLNELTYPPVLMLCNLISSGTPTQVPDALGKLCGQLEPVLSGLVPLPSIAQTITALRNGQLPPLLGAGKSPAGQSGAGK